jgi:hypothetical protein
MQMHPDRSTTHHPKPWAIRPSERNNSSEFFIYFYLHFTSWSDTPLGGDLDQRLSGCEDTPLGGDSEHLSLTAFNFYHIGSYYLLCVLTSFLVLGHLPETLTIYVRRLLVRSSNVQVAVPPH